MSRLAGTTDAAHRVNFHPGSEGDVPPSPFNPLVQFDHIGRERLEQVSPPEVYSQSIMATVHFIIELQTVKKK